MFSRATSRRLAERVEIESQRHPNRFSRACWWSALALGGLSAVWLTGKAVEGDQRIYSGGPLATPHTFIDNRCDLCHAGAEWTPLSQLLAASPGEKQRHSIDNAKCVACHDVPHHANQAKFHQETACAKCHRDHRGDVDLSSVADQHCIRCHADLNQHGGTGTFAAKITGFETDHPEFAVHRVLAGLAVPQSHGVYEMLTESRREGKEEKTWHNGSRIRFNHAKHLQPTPGGDGWQVLGIDGTRQRIDCIDCHQPDDAGRYMRPINYEQHCSRCHPLYFDVTGHPGETVPHESPEVVRGHLTQLFTLEVLRSPTKEKVTSDWPSPRLPGQRAGKELDVSQARQVATRVARAEQAVRQHTFALLDRTAKGGCRFCHDVEDRPAADGLLRPTWHIVPPEIPARWSTYSRFDHAAHRILDCTACHQDPDRFPADKSSRTGDVLLPKKQQCLKCHSRSTQAQGAIEGAGARTSCIECHNYHDAHGDERSRSHKTSDDRTEHR